MSHLELVCKRCKQAKAHELFNLCAMRPSGRQNWCVSCHQEYRLSTKELRSSYQKTYYTENCDRIKKQAREYASNNAGKIKEGKAKWYKETIVERLLYEAKKRATKKGIDFSINADDLVIPEVCPVLGIPIIISSSGSGTSNSPSLDRVDSSQGYTPCNVRVISWRANRLKSDATLHEVESLAKYMREQCQN